MRLHGRNEAGLEERNDLAAYFNQKYGREPDAIVFLWNFSPELCDRIRSQLPQTRIVLWTDDLHWYTKERYLDNKYSYDNADIILAHYDYFKPFYNMDLGDRLIRMPHSAGSHFARNEVNEAAIPQIFMFGAMSDCYRLRKWFAQKMQAEYAELFVMKAHPGYEGNQFQQSIETGNELHRYAFAFTAGAFPIFEVKETPDTPYYLIGKFLEIPGSGALLLCNDYGVREQLNALGFYDMVNYVNIDETNYHERMTWLLDPANKDRILQMRKAGHALVQEKHTTQKRMEAVNEELKRKLTLSE